MRLWGSCLLGVVLFLSSCRTPSSSPTAPEYNGSWHQFGSTNGLIVTSLMVANSGSALLAGSYGQGVYRSTAGGTDMVPVNSGLINSLILSMTSNTTTIFAGTNGAGVYRSLDNGTSWQPANSNLTTDTVLALYASGTVLFAGTAHGGVYRSADNGITWLRVNTGIGNWSVQSIVAYDTIVLAGTSRGIFSSPDSGTSWNEIGPTNVSVLAFVTLGKNIFAGTEGDGVLLSTDAGVTWNPAGLSNSTVRALAGRGNDLFAGTPNGVLLSTNSGTTWIPNNTGFFVNAVAVDSTNVYAGTEGNGVWYMPLSDLPQ